MLATDGSDALSWVARTANNELGSLTDVDLATQLLVAMAWFTTRRQACGVPQRVSNVDLSSSSINALQDVDTSTYAPTDGQALVWDNANGVWVRALSPRICPAKHWTPWVTLT